MGFFSKLFGGDDSKNDDAQAAPMADNMGESTPTSMHAEGETMTGDEEKPSV